MARGFVRADTAVSGSDLEDENAALAIGRCQPLTLLVKHHFLLLSFIILACETDRDQKFGG